MAEGVKCYVTTDEIYSRLLVAGYTANSLGSYVFYINGTGENIYDLQLIPTISIFSNIQSKIQAMSYDYSESLVFWSDSGHNSILALSFVGESPVWHPYNGTSHVVEGVAVDWLAKNVYWTDAAYNWIKVSNYNGTYYRSLITTGLDHPSGIACNPLTGLYWTDNLYGAVKSLDLDNVAAPPKLVFPFPESAYMHALGVDPNFGFFLTVQHGNRLWIIPKTFGKGVRYITFHDEAILTGVAYYSADRQPYQQSQCDNDDCDQLCINTPSSYECICTYGYQLGEDGKSCELDNSVIKDHELIISFDEGVLCKLPANVAHDPFHNLVCFTNVTVNAMDVDIHGHYVFAYIPPSTADGQIGRMRLEQGENWYTIYQTAMDVRGIAVDWAAVTLYWTDFAQERIMISDFDGKYTTELISTDVHEPSAIVVFAPEMFLFWSETGSNPRIVRSDLTGLRRMDIVTMDIQLPRQLVVDINNKRIYWADDGTLLIESVNLNGLQRDVFQNFSEYQRSAHFTGLTIFQGHLYVTEVDEKVLDVYDIHSKILIQWFNYHVHPTALKFFHTSLQPSTEGPCDLLNGDCAEICINTKYGAVCICSNTPAAGNCTSAATCPLTIPNGQMSAECDNTEGNSCNIVCAEGYVPVTLDPVICTRSGDWEEGNENLCRHESTFPCYSHPCENNGTCIELTDTYNCTCQAEWVGDNCEAQKNIELPPRPKSATIPIVVSVVIIVLLIVVVVVFFVYRKMSNNRCLNGTLLGPRSPPAKNDYDNCINLAATELDSTIASAPPAPKPVNIYMEPTMVNDEPIRADALYDIIRPRVDDHTYDKFPESEGIDPNATPDYMHMGPINMQEPNSQMMDDDYLNPSELNASSADNQER
ncbi:low-density lipoprotein receptor-related protein 2-like [Glandiceps talaboti]